MIGAGLLWTGWYGFNVGSIVFTSDSLKDPAKFSAQFYGETGVTFMNTTIATMAAMLGWLAVERLLHGKATSLGAASGVVAGLVAITPSCGAVSILGALIIGVIAGAVCSVAIGMKYKLGLDDSLDVVGVHLTGGILGALLIGFLGTRTSPQGLDGLFTDANGHNMNGIFYGGSPELLLHQFLGVLFTIVWCGVFTALIGLAIKYTIGWRITADEEVDGIDFAEHGESAYDLEGRSGGMLGGSTGIAAASPAKKKEGALA
jgi:Amt family ammonium transporter